MFEKLAQEFATLFVIISPPAILPVFLAITANLGREARRHVALRCCLIAGTILLLFLALGQLVLLSMGVKLAAFRMAGALILLIFCMIPPFNSILECAGLPAL